MLRRTQTIYLETDAFFSARGKVLHGFERFLDEMAQTETPCIWLSGWTRAQLDEPRRRLGQNDPFIGESGCGVYLPEDYFHLKGAKTIRLGRYTCIPIAKPQPAAAEAVDELASDLNISVVPLRTLSPRELSQNTGLPAREGELLRLRDFDELFFFAGAGDDDIRKFQLEAKLRGCTVRRADSFWSLACGADLARCVRELGGLYDRALRSHAARVGVHVVPKTSEESLQDEMWPQSAFDRTLRVAQHLETQRVPRGSEHTEEADDRTEADAVEPEELEPRKSIQAKTNKFYLHAPDVWESVINSIKNQTPASRPGRS
jgi:hypothetical protein